MVRSPIVMPALIAGIPLAGLVLALFLGPALLMWLWNMTVPEIFSLPQIEFWQAFRLIIIVGVLFGLAHFI